MKSIGKYFLFLFSMFQRMETFRTYFRLIMEECVSIGIGSIFLVGLVATFMGAVTTVQTAYNLVSPFIPDYIIATVVRDMTILELAPTIIAIIFAGKVGSNMAGELGTMRITEQIDALEVMGINSVSYLVFPKIIASILMYPLLVIIAAGLSILGGYLAGTFAEILSPYDYKYGIQYLFIDYMVKFAIIKSYAFAFLIASISSFRGYYTTGGALEVGKASTRAVTDSVIAILLADYLLAEMLLT